MVRDSILDMCNIEKVVSDLGILSSDNSEDKMSIPRSPSLSNSVTGSQCVEFSLSRPGSDRLWSW